MLPVIPEKIKFTSRDVQNTRGVLNREMRRRFRKLSQQGKMTTAQLPVYLVVGKRK